MLCREGFPEESLILDGFGVLDAAEEAAEHALTPLLPGYPSRWRHSLGAFAPPALWQSGNPFPTAWFGIVGSREIPSQCRKAAIDVAQAAVNAGYGLVSGGAVGADQIASQVAEALGAPLLTIYPRGNLPTNDYGHHLCLAAPGEPFSAGLAMERNSLIYAASEATFVAHARFRTGGSWHGATDALRRGLTRVCVPSEVSEEGLLALSRLGATPLTSSSISGYLTAPPSSQRLFQLTG